MVWLCVACASTMVRPRKTRSVFIVFLHFLVFINPPLWFNLLILSSSNWSFSRSSLCPKNLISELSLLFYFLIGKTCRIKPFKCSHAPTLTSLSRPQPSYAHFLIYCPINLVLPNRLHLLQSAFLYLTYIFLF